MFNSALIPEHEINKENIISQDYNLLSDNNPNVIWSGNKVQLRRPNGLSNPKKLKFRSFQTELLPYTSLELPQLKTELYLTTSTEADSVTVGGKYNRFGIGPLLKTEYNTSDNKSEVLDSFTKAWTYNADYNSQIDYNIKECIDYANIRFNEWLETVDEGYIYKDYDDYILREYSKENIGILPKYNYSDSICSIVGNKVAIATYNDDTNKLDINLCNTAFNRVSNCSLICASSNRELIYAVGSLQNNQYADSHIYYLRNSDKKYIKFLGFHWGWGSDTFLMPGVNGCTMSKNYSLINAANSSGEGWRRGRFCLMYHGDVNDNPPVKYEFQDTVIGTFPNHEVVCVAIAETYSTLPGNFYALFANYNRTTKKVDLYFGQIRIGSDPQIEYIPLAEGTMEMDYWNSNKFMDCAMGMAFDDEVSFVASTEGTIFNFSNKVMLKVVEGEILDVKRYYNYKSFNYQDPDNKYCCFGGLAGPGEERNYFMVKESDLDTETLYNQGLNNTEIFITSSDKPIYSIGSNAGFIQTNKEDGVQTTGGLNGKALYITREKLINLRDGAYVEGQQTYNLANQDLNYSTTPEEGKLINIVDNGGQNSIIHPQLLFTGDKVANIGLRIYTEPYYFEVFHDDNYYTSPLYSLYPVSDTMKTHFINSHVYNTLETIILMQYEYNDLMLRVNQFPNNDNVVFSSGDVARVAFKVMDINTTTEFLNCELATNSEDAITKEDLKRIYGKVSVSCDWIQ